MKKYCVHMGVRYTKDYYIIAHDEDEAESLAEELFEVEECFNMDCAGTDSDVWEEDFDESEADEIVEDDDSDKRFL